MRTNFNVFLSLWVLNSSNNTSNFFWGYFPANDLIDRFKKQSSPKIAQSFSVPRQPAITRDPAISRKSSIFAWSAAKPRADLPSKLEMLSKRKILMERLPWEFSKIVFGQLCQGFRKLLPESFTEVTSAPDRSKSERHSSFPCGVGLSAWKIFKLVDLMWLIGFESRMIWLTDWLAANFKV